MFSSVVNVKLHLYGVVRYDFDGVVRFQRDHETCEQSTLIHSGTSSYGGTCRSILALYTQRVGISVYTRS